MDVVPARQSLPARVLVSIDNPNNPIPEARRNQYTPDKTLKTKVITALVHAHTRLCVMFRLTEGQMFNLSLTTQVTSCLNTIHAILRQTANPQGRGKITEKVNSYQIHVGDDKRELEKNLAHETVAAIFKIYDLDYSQQPFPAPWIGVMSPYLTFMSCFKHRLDEIRTGVGRFPIGKNAQGQTQVADLSQFGLNSSHHVNCEGITYPPVKRTSMAQSIGPLAQLILLNQSRKSPNYSEKWKRATARSISHIPHHNEIIEYIFSHDAATIGPYMAVLGDLLNITGSRAAVKAFFPFSVFYACIVEQARETLKQAPVSPRAGQPAQYSPVVLAGIGNVDHSGRGAFIVYNLVKDVDFTMNLNCDAKIAAAIFFHAIWGSHLEDINVLKFMTDVDFPTRQAVGAAFRGRGTTAKAVSFKPIAIKAYAKLSQALPTDKTAGGQQQIINRVTFSGKRKILLGESFRAYYKKQRTQSSSFSGVSNLYASLSNYKNQVLAGTIKDGFIVQGVVDWRSTKDLSHENPGVVHVQPTASAPRLFYASEVATPMEAGDEMDAA